MTGDKRVKALQQEIEALEEEIRKLRYDKKINRTLLEITNTVNTTPNLHDLYLSIHQSGISDYLKIIKESSAWNHRRGQGRILLSGCRYMIDGGSHESCSEPVIDIHHGNIGTARIEHAEKCGNPAKTCSITDTGGNGNNR